MAKKTAKAPAFPLFGDLTERKMRSLGEKLDKLQDPNGFKHYDLLSKSTDGPNNLLLWHLVRCGLVAQSAQSTGLYRRLGEYIPDDVTAADVILVLRHVPEDMSVLDKGKARDHHMYTRGMVTAIDELLVHAYVRDPAAIRAVAPELPENLQIAIDFVRRRAGETIDPGRSLAILRFLAIRHADQGIALNTEVPRIVDGEVVVHRLADDAAVLELAELFGPRSAWAEIQLEWLRPRVKKFRSTVEYATARVAEGLRIAGLRDLIYLFGDGYWRHSGLLQILDLRADPAESLLAASDEILRDGLAPFRIDVPQLPEDEDKVRSTDNDDDDDDDEGEGDDDYESDDEYDDYDDYESSDDDDGEVEEEPDAGPESERVRALAEALTVLAIERLAAAGQPIPVRCDEALDFDRVYDSDPTYIERLRRALGLLGATRAHAVIRRVLAKVYFFGKAAGFADVCHDPAVVEAVLDRLDKGAYGVEADLLGFNGPAIIPAIAAHAAAIDDAKKKTEYGEAINYILARASAAGVAWDRALDRHIHLAAIRFSYGGSKVTPVLAMLDALPLDRYEAVFRQNLERCADQPTALCRCLRVDAPDAVIELAFTAVMARGTKLSSGDLGDRLRALGARVVAPLRRAFGDTPAQGTLMREIERALESGAFESFKASLSGPIETREEELRRLSAGIPGPKTRIYRLRRAEREPAEDEVGRIGGTPRGVKAADVPKHRGEPMTHVLTLDLARLPGLRPAVAGARSLSLYLPDPSYGEHHEAGELVWRSEAELADEAGSIEDAAAIEVDAVDVPSAIFNGRAEGDLGRIRQMVYASAGYVLGGPLWLQEGPEGEDPDFLFQFDESLCYINLGDCGVMYVFGNDISWQCH